MNLTIRMSAAALLLVVVAGCGQASTAPTGTGSTGAPTQAPAAASVICDFFTDAGGGKDIQDAAVASFSGGNEAASLRKGIDKVQALAARAPADEAKDLLALATKLDAVALSGGTFADWSDAYDAFYVKWADDCGQPVAS